ncbi:MAG: hypothetical protein ACFB6S_06265 [Geminicoccaceae bacterium]
MSRPIRMMAAALLLLAAGPTQGELLKRGSSSTKITSEGALQVACWQEGVKIIDETALEGVNIGALIESETLIFRELEDGDKRVLVVPLDEALCLVKSVPGG